MTHKPRKFRLKSFTVFEKFDKSPGLQIKKQTGVNSRSKATIHIFSQSLRFLLQLGAS